MQLQCWINFSLRLPQYHVELWKTNPPEHYKKHWLQIVTEMDVTETILIKTLLFGNCFADAFINTQILDGSTEFFLTTERFGKPLFHSFFILLFKKILLVFLYLISWQEYVSFNWRLNCSRYGKFCCIMFCILLFCWKIKFYFTFSFYFVLRLSENI